MGIEKNKRQEKYDNQRERAREAAMRRLSAMPLRGAQTQMFPFEDVNYSYLGEVLQQCAQVGCAVLIGPTKRGTVNICLLLEGQKSNFICSDAEEMKEALVTISGALSEYVSTMADSGADHGLKG